ncbi:MAG: DNA mismatch repair protein MutL, partial [Mesorhizobium sp.]
LVRGLIVGAIREAMAGAGIRAATTGAAGMMAAFRPGAASYSHPGPANGHRSYEAAFRASGSSFDHGSNLARSPQRPLDMGEARPARGGFA